MVEARDRRFVDIAAEVMADEERTLGITYSGFCLTALPHRRIADDEHWERRGNNITLVVEPGFVRGRDGSAQRIGVPYGARARIILIYLQTQAVRTGSRHVELGGSMRAWMTRMGVSVGGETARGLSDQARRISACAIRFLWTAERDGQIADGFTKGSIVTSGMFLRDAGAAQSSLFDDTVTLDEAFFKGLREHPVPLLEAAVKALKEKSLALDLYVWLAYRLHSLSRPVRVSWPAQYGHFGAAFRHPPHFKAHYLEALRAALAAYPDARVELERDGIVLSPSRPPVLKVCR